MKGLLFLTVLLSFAMLLFILHRYPDNVLDEVNDGEFRKYLVDAFDRNNDNKITGQEALSVTDMSPGYDCMFTDISGIEYFENLVLYIHSYGREKSVDLSGNNKIRRVSLTEMANLVEFKCNKEIEDIVLTRTSLVKLSLGNMPQLKSFVCCEGHLISFNTGSAPLLKNLCLKSNELMKLDLSKYPSLETLDCSNNNLSFLDIRNNPNLKGLKCKRNSSLTLLMNRGQKIYGINEDPDYEAGMDKGTVIKYKR